MCWTILYGVCQCTEESKQELWHVKSERDQIGEDLLNAENAFIDEKKCNENLKLIMNEHKTVRKKFVHLFTWSFFYRIRKH